MALPVFAAKRRRKRARLLKGVVTETLAIGALAANDAIGDNYDQTTEERSFMLSQEATWAIVNHTAGEGGIIVGVAHSDYTDAEIEEFLEVSDSWNEGNLIDQERSNRGRRIKIVGIFSGDKSDDVLNDGKPIKTSLKFTLTSAQTLKLFAYNTSAAVLTTGTILVVTGHVWIKLL